MKKTLIIIFISLCFSQAGRAQINLVTNPSFEQYTACPVYPGDFYPLNWNGYKSPDYFNACDDSLYYTSVPNNWAGYQFAKTGNGYTGLFTRATSNTVPNYREIMGCKLIDTLTISTKYYVSFYANLANYSNCATNNLGVLFTTIPIDFNVYPVPLTNFSQIYSQTIIIDTAKWICVSGEFYADSSYTYLYIGNFYDNLNTDSILFDTTVIVPPFVNYIDSICWTYYYIDDVCVSTDSLLCNLPVAINVKNITNNEISLFPIPTSNIININLNNANLKTINCKIYDMYSRKILQLQNIKNPCQIDVSEYAEGTYILQIQVDNLVINRKLIIYKP